MVCLLGSGIHFPQGQAVLASDAGAIFILGREHRRPAVLPAELALDRSPGRAHRAGAALELVPAAGELLEEAGDDELDEQAARPAARRPVAASATALLLVILLVVNFDLSSRVVRNFEKELCFSG